MEFADQAEVVCLSDSRNNGFKAFVVNAVAVLDVLRVAKVDGGERWVEFEELVKMLLVLAAIDFVVLEFEAN